MHVWVMGCGKVKVCRQEHPQSLIAEAGWAQLLHDVQLCTVLQEKGSIERRENRAAEGSASAKHHIK